MAPNLKKRFLAAFLLLTFGHAFDVRLHALDAVPHKFMGAEWLLELDEPAELDQASPIFDESGDLEYVEDDLRPLFCLTGLSSENYANPLSDLQQSESSRWCHCAAEKGARVPLYLLYHSLKGY